MQPFRRVETALATCNQLLSVLHLSIHVVAAWLLALLAVLQDVGNAVYPNAVYTTDVPMCTIDVRTCTADVPMCTIDVH